jgi:hypothetical protein
MVGRTFRRWEEVPTGASVLGLAMVLMVAAYGFGAAESRPALGDAAAAVAAIAIAGSGLLYAFRLGAGGRID